jgi:hypothetical protein
MNLILVQGRAHVDMYQTSTDLTYKVLKATTKEEQLKLIEEDLGSRNKNHELDEWSIDQLNDIKACLDDGFHFEMI